MLAANGHMRFSVIIPALNEEAAIGATIDRVIAQSGECEILVADGGSEDATAEIAREKGATVVLSARGRGIQCNAGARRAGGDLLLFLHADTLLPGNAISFLQAAFEDPHLNVGTFRLAFDSGEPLLRFYSFFTRFDSMFTTFGDQCIVVRAKFFRELGGFPEWKLFEDVEFLKRARRQTRIRAFPLAVTTSARRFKVNGVLRQQLRNFQYVAQFLLGAGDEYLARAYATSARSGTALVIFAKYPAGGNVKTRLAADLGAEEAAEAYAACAQKVFGEARAAHAFTTKFIYSPPEDDRARMRRWGGRGFRYRPQKGELLGDRMDAAFAEMFSQNVARVILAGSDIIGLGANVLDEAVRRLDSSDVVVGPALDGGYYLIGMNRRHSELFENIAWGTAVVLKQTLAAAQELSLTVAMLPPLRDLDTLADYESMLSQTSANSTTHILNPLHPI